MKFLLITFTLISFNSYASVSKFECKYLDYYLELESKGFEHIVHILKINSETTITELVEYNWFIEEVKCDKSGYKIIASHIQFNDPTNKIFKLTFNKKQGYKLEIAQ